MNKNVQIKTFTYQWNSAESLILSDGYWLEILSCTQIECFNCHSQSEKLLWGWTWEHFCSQDFNVCVYTETDLHK